LKRTERSYGNEATDLESPDITINSALMAPPPDAPNLLSIILQYTEPLQACFMIFLYGIFPALRYMIFHPFRVFSIYEWHKRILAGGLRPLLAMVDKLYAPVKKEVLEDARGRILEVGAGTGETVKYYDRAKVDVIYGVEPNLEALPTLREKVAECDLEDKYQILPFGIEESGKLAEAGVFPGSIDTIVCASLRSISGLMIGNVLMFNTDPRENDF
jgi:hypothetical protein